MPNDWYVPSGSPSTGSQGSSSVMRGEFALLKAAFDKLAGLTGNSLKVVRVNSGESGFEAVAVTGTGSAVMSTSPTLVTPALGVATGTSLALSGALTAASAAVTGQLTSTVAIGTAPLVITSTTLVPNLYVARSVLADAVTTNANLTGPITSSGNATAVASQTGTGTKFVMDNAPTITSPTFVTPALGAATGTSLALGGGTALTTTNQTGTGNLVLAASPTITGTLTLDTVNITNVSGLICKTDTSHSIQIAGGNVFNSGAHLDLLGPGLLNGQWGLTANDGVTTATLTGQKDGTLTWNGATVWRSDNLVRTSRSSYTPTVSATSGAITTSAVNDAWFERVGNMVFVLVDISITNAGTGTGTQFTLPVAPNFASYPFQFLPGREVSRLGPMIQVPVTGTTVAIQKYDNTGMCTTGDRYVVSGFYSV